MHPHLDAQQPHDLKFFWDNQPNLFDRRRGRAIGYAVPRQGDGQAIVAPGSPEGPARESPPGQWSCHAHALGGRGPGIRLFWLLWPALLRPPRKRTVEETDTLLQKPLRLLDFTDRA